MKKNITTVGSLLTSSLYVASLALSGCGTKSEVSPYATKSSNDEPAVEDTFTDDATGDDSLAGDTNENSTHGQKVDDIVVPPKEYYDALFKNTLNDVDDQDRFSLTNNPVQTLFVNFDGANLTKGFGQGQSFILCDQAATIPAPAFSQADKDDIMALVQKFYADAGANLNVVSAQPSAGPFTTMHVGGSYADLGCRGNGVLGVAPFDPGNLNPADVGFAFTNGIMSNLVVAETIAHEAGHSFGLDHINNNTAIMYFQSAPGITGFGAGTVAGTGKLQDSPAILKDVLGLLGTSTPVPLPSPVPTTPSPVAGIPNLPTDLTAIPGLDQLGAIAGLIPGMTGSTGNIDISSVLPILVAVAGGGSLTGIDQILAIVGIASAAGQNQNGLPGGLPIDPALAASILGGLTGGSTGGFDINALLGLAGMADINDAISLISGLLGNGSNVGLPIPGAGGATPIPAINGVPDLSALLGLVGGSAGTSQIDLITNLIGTARVVNGNYTGSQRDALMSMVRVAYSQAYQQQAQAPTK